MTIVFKTKMPPDLADYVINLIEQTEFENERVQAHKDGREGLIFFLLHKETEYEINQLFAQDKDENPHEWI